MNVWIGINALLGLVGPSYAMKVPAPFASLLSLYVKRALIGYRQLNLLLSCVAAYHHIRPHHPDNISYPDGNNSHLGNVHIRNKLC